MKWGRYVNNTGHKYGHVCHVDLVMKWMNKNPMEGNHDEQDISAWTYTVC